MKAWIIDRTDPSGDSPLRPMEVPDPQPAVDELLVDVAACGVCRTDLHLAAGDIPPRRSGVIPGHEVVGTVRRIGSGVDRFSVGDRVGIAWLRQTCGICRWCRSGAENLCRKARFTGWDDNGGYAQQAVVSQKWAYRMPESWSDEQAAPLLCAGIIGYRALRLAKLPSGGRLGIYGFGASAHLAAQLALHLGATVHVLTRSESARKLAIQLGCASAGGARDAPPEPLDAAVLFAPAGDLVPLALQALEQGGTLAVAGIHLSDIPPLNYQDHLFRERILRSVTANTRADGEQFLSLAAAMKLEVHTQPYRFEKADRALLDLAADQVEGAAVLVM